MKFDLQPTHLHNERIRLIPLQKTDFDRLFELVSESKSPNKKRNSSTKKNEKNKQNHKTSKKRV